AVALPVRHPGAGPATVHVGRPRARRHRSGLARGHRATRPVLPGRGLLVVPWYPVRGGLDHFGRGGAPPAGGRAEVAADPGPRARAVRRRALWRVGLACADRSRPAGGGATERSVIGRTPTQR